MKRHILRTTSIEQFVDADDKELECLLQAQENEYKATQRFESILCFHFL